MLGGHAYFVLTGQLLIAAGALMVFKQTPDTVDARPVRFGPAAAVGGGVLLAPLLITLRAFKILGEITRPLTERRSPISAKSGLFACF